MYSSSVHTDPTILSNDSPYVAQHISIDYVYSHTFPMYQRMYAYISRVCIHIHVLQYVTVFSDPHHHSMSCQIALQAKRQIFSLPHEVIWNIAERGKIHLPSYVHKNSL